MISVLQGTLILTYRYVSSLYISTVLDTPHVCVCVCARHCVCVCEREREREKERERERERGIVLDNIFVLYYIDLSVVAF
jgi:hypothetical protein